MPARPVVVLGGLVEAHLQVMVGTDPLGGVDDAAIQVGINLPAGHQHGIAAGSGHHFAAQSRNSHLKAFVVGDGLDLFVEPSASLDTGVAGEEGFDLERCIDFFPQFQTTAVQDPGVHALCIEAERYGREKLACRGFTGPVICGAVAHLNRALADSIEHAQRGHQLAAAVNRDIQAAVAHLFTPLGKKVGTFAECRKMRRPGGDHLPSELFFFGNGRRHTRRNSRADSRSTQTKFLDKTTSLHLPSSSSF